MTLEKAFPFVLITLMVIASVPYWMQGDWRRGCYWLCAAAINLVVTL